MIETLQEIVSQVINKEVVKLSFDRRGFVDVAGAPEPLAAKLRTLFNVSSKLEKMPLPFYATDWGCDDFIEVALDYLPDSGGTQQAARNSSNALTEMIGTLLRNNSVEKLVVVTHQFDFADRTKQFLERKSDWLEWRPDLAEVFRLHWITAWRLDSVTHLHETALRLDAMHRAAARSLGLEHFGPSRTYQDRWESSGSLCEQIKVEFLKLWQDGSSELESPDVFD